MTTSQAEPSDDVLLVLAPAGRDGSVVAQTLRGTGIRCQLDEAGEPLIKAIGQGHAAGAVVTEEGLSRIDQAGLRQALEQQPPWSDFPIILLSQRGKPLRQGSRLIEALGNVTILERPLHPSTLVSAARSVVRSRRRQRLAEAYLRERERAEVSLRELAGTLEAKVQERTRELAAANDRLTAEIAERERTEAKLVQAQKMEAIGQLTGGIAHDFNNLLTAVVGALELLVRRTDDEKILRLARSAMQGAERGARLTAQLLGFSRRQRLTPAPVDVNAVVTQMGDLLARTLGSHIRVETKLEPRLWHALADRTQLEVMILNLAINARDAMPAGGRLTIETRNTQALPARLAGELSPGSYITLAIRDTGVGMAPSVMARAFEPFYTTKEPGKGIGLGLSQVYGFAQQSGGTVTLDSRIDEGSEVTIYLPRTEAAASHDEVDQAQIRPVERPCILLVDDDDDVRNIAAAMLEEIGYELVALQNGTAALDMLRTQSFDLLLTDVAMPVMNGVELARRAREIAPGMPVLFASGYADIDAFGAKLADEDLVKKPYRIAELASRVASMLASQRSTKLNVINLQTRPQTATRS